MRSDLDVRVGAEGTRALGNESLPVLRNSQIVRAPTTSTQTNNGQDQVPLPVEHLVTSFPSVT